jgi:hypothetical protein
MHDRPEATHAVMWQVFALSVRSPPERNNTAWSELEPNRHTALFRTNSSESALQHSGVTTATIHFWRRELNALQALSEGHLVSYLDQYASSEHVKTE